MVLVSKNRRVKVVLGGDKDLFVEVELQASGLLLLASTPERPAYPDYEGERSRAETPTETARAVPPRPPPPVQVTRLTLCALEVFLRRRDASGGALDSPAPADLASAVLGSDLPVVFPEARVKRACARGVLPPTEVASRGHGDVGGVTNAST